MDYRANDKIVPVVCVMPDHVRLSKKDCIALLGHAEPSVEQRLGQKGEYLTSEKIEVEFKNGQTAMLPIIMPFVNKTVVSLCSSTLARLGGKADLKRPSGAPCSDRCVLRYVDVYRNEYVEKRNAVIRPLRHVHIPLSVREVYGIALGDTLIAEVNNDRGVILDQVYVEDSDNVLGEEIELHIDKDEGYAFGISEGLTYAKLYLKEQK